MADINYDLLQNQQPKQPVDAYGNAVNQSTNTSNIPQTPYINPAFSTVSNALATQGINSATIGNQTINSSGITQNNPIKLPTPTTDTATSAVNASSAALADQLTQQQQQAQTAKDTSRSDLASAVADIANVQNQYKSDYGDINTPGTVAYNKEQARLAGNKLLLSQRAQTNEIRQVQETPGITQEQAQQKIGEINRRYALEQADLQVNYHLANSDYLAAQDSLDQKLKLQLAPLQTKYDYLKTVYDDNKDLLSKSQDKQFQLQIKNIDAENARQKANADQISEWGKQIISSSKDNPQLLSLLPGLQSLDPTSKTFQQDLGKVTQQIGNIQAQTQQTQGIVPGQKPTGKASPQDAAYATRTLNANSKITELGNKFTGIFSFGGLFPTQLQSKKRAQYEQAKRNFVNAVLRKESGAAISPSEFSSAEKQYFPEAGDDTETVRQKAINRIDAINGLIGAAGKAYNGVYLAYPENQQDNPFIKALNGGNSIFDPNTQLFNIPTK